MSQAQEIIRELKAIEKLKRDSTKAKRLTALLPKLNSYKADVESWFNKNSRYVGYGSGYLAKSVLAVNIKLSSFKAFMLNSDEAEELGVTEFNTESYWNTWLANNYSYLKEFVSLGKNGEHITLERYSEEYNHLTYLTERGKNDTHTVGASGGWFCLDSATHWYASHQEQIDEALSRIDEDFTCTQCNSINAIDDIIAILIYSISEISATEKALAWLQAYVDKAKAGLDFKEECLHLKECELEFITA